MDKNKSESPRYFADAELRVVDSEGGKPQIVGYAAVFNTRSFDLGGFVEEIAPGAFTEALAATNEVLALVEHDPKMPLGRRSVGTLRLQQDDRGLRVEIDPADTTVGRDAVENIRSRNYKGMSFRFPRGAQDSWRMENGMPVRTIHKCGLKEVTVTAIPAYGTTDVSVRALTDEEEAEMRSYYEEKIAALQPKEPVKPDYTVAESRLRMLMEKGFMSPAELRAISEYEDNSLVYACRETISYARSTFDQLQRVCDMVNAMQGTPSDADRVAANDCVSAVIDLIGKAKLAKVALTAMGAKDAGEGSTE